MKITIEKNEKYGEGYQIRIAYDNGDMDLIDWKAYSMKHALMMAEKAMEIIQRKSDEELEISAVLELDKESLFCNRDYDELSAWAAEKLDANREGITAEEDAESITIEE